MNAIASLIIIIALTMSTGCARNAYEGLRLRQDNECQKLHGLDQDECLRRSAPGYDDYQRQTREKQDDKK